MSCRTAGINDVVTEAVRVHDRFTWVLPCQVLAHGSSICEIAVVARGIRCHGFEKCLGERWLDQERPLRRTRRTGTFKPRSRQTRSCIATLRKTHQLNVVLDAWVKHAVGEFLLAYGGLKQCPRWKGNGQIALQRGCFSLLRRASSSTGREFKIR